MEAEYYVDKKSVVREIWGKGDTILLIFAGAAAEFALNKAVDWLYFTGRLPADPLGRLFSTVAYARAIVFAEQKDALRAIDSITAVHSAVEAKRGANIPDWAYRDVLFLLIDYSIKSFEVMERKLSIAEKEEVFSVFNSIGIRMGINGLPQTFEQWKKMRHQHLISDMQHSHYTVDLFRQYRKHLSPVRYQILLESQLLVVPQEVRKLLGFREVSLLSPLIGVYKLCRTMKLDRLFKSIIMPSKYIKEIRGLDVH
jgi:uncharacterized protein (DUF2236 family)